MTAVFSNWCNTIWRGQEVRLTFTDRRPDFSDVSGMAIGLPHHEVVIELVITRQDFEQMRAAWMQVPTPDPWPPTPPPVPQGEE